MLLQMRRWGWWALALLTLAGAGPAAAAQQEAVQREAVREAAPQEAVVPVYPAPSQAEQKIYEALAQPTQLEFIETPLSDVVDFLEDHHQIQIALDGVVLDAVGIGSDTPITRNLKGVPLSSALTLVLRSLDLTYVVRDDVLLITTTEAAEKMVQLRVYDVSKLLTSGESADTLGRVLRETLTPASERIDPGDAFVTPEQELARRERGPGRVISGYRNLLLVRDSFHGHQQIARALHAIGQGLANAAPRSAIISPAAPTEAPPAADEDPTGEDASSESES